MNSISAYDVVVVGGGAAGLSAAVALARSLRSVVVVDAGEPRNAPADGAHNLLGRVNYEIMDLPRIARFVARRLVGNEALRESSWEDAEHHLRLAAELWPDNVLFQLDLGDLYERRGRDDEAREVFRRMVDMPSVHPADDSFKDSARRFLEELGS